MDPHFIHIKGALCSVDGKPCVKVKITEQSHRGVNFNPKPQKEYAPTGRSWCASNGVKLLSHFNPEFAYRKGEIKFFVRGTDTFRNEEIVNMTPRQYEMVVEAIEEYNLKFGAKTEDKKTTGVQVFLKQALEDCREELINLREEQEITDEKIDELEEEAAKIRMTLATYEGKT